MKQRIYYTVEYWIPGRRKWHGAKVSHATLAAARISMRYSKMALQDNKIKGAIFEIVRHAVREETFSSVVWPKPKKRKKTK